jgi:large subunit ribosomal protein L54
MYKIFVLGLTSGKSKRSSKFQSGQKKTIIPVEKDIHKLLKYCCGTNILKDGQDVELKPDSEYPDWLWNIRTKKAKHLQHLDPNTKEYWRKQRKLAIKRKTRLNLLKKF